MSFTRVFSTDIFDRRNFFSFSNISVTARTACKGIYMIIFLLTPYDESLISGIWELSHMTKFPIWLFFMKRFKYCMASFSISVSMQSI